MHLISTLHYLDGRTWIVCHLQGHISFHQQELLDEPAAPVLVCTIVYHINDLIG